MNLTHLLFLRWWVFLAVPLAATAQPAMPLSPMALVAVDSVSIALPTVSRRYARPYFRAEGKFLYYLQAADSLYMRNRPEHVRVYALDGGAPVADLHVQPGARPAATELVAVVGTRDGAYVGYGMRSFLRLRWRLGPQVPDTLKLDGAYQGRQYALNLYRPAHYPSILPDGRWVLSVFENPVRYHFSPQLLALCRLEGSQLVIERLLGPRDPLYRRYRLAHLEATHFAVNDRRQTLYLAQEASPTIRECTWQGQEVSTFGQAGQRPGVRATPRRAGFSLSWVRGTYALSRARVESPTYQFLCYDPLTDAVARTYKEAEKTQLDWPTFRTQEKASQAACNVALPPTAQAQLNVDQDRARPTHVQVYQNRQLVLDAPVPRGFQLLKAEGGQLWGVGLPDFDHKTVTLYTYRYQVFPSPEAQAGKSPD